ncbi:MAG: coenzyme F420-reducing hydrogenase, FrhD protein [Methanosphaera stadtmanae]|nr:coenzyme F420-reducing hydrogenase, FrhD protein [Methanosphaera stadtmanae]
MSYNHENLIIGCGNILYGDDGFGPEVIRYIKENNIKFPGDTFIIDGATSAPHYIFTLPQEKWKNIIIIDIASLNEKSGTIKVLDLDQIREEDRYMDVHGLSATYPLHDLKDKINIKLIVIQPENIPLEMKMGLSKVLEDKIPQTVNKTIETLNSMLSK